MEPKPARIIIILLTSMIFSAGCSLSDNRSQSADSVAPVISGAGSSSLTNFGALISWTTDEPATSTVRYGTDAAYGSIKENGELTTAHAVWLSGLQAHTGYHFMVLSADGSGNRSESDDMGFTTTDVSAVSSAYYGQWENGLPSDSGFFPIAVWLQDPSNADAYMAIGINTYVGLWDGPTDAQLTALHDKGLYAIGSQNDTGLTSPYNDVIRAWMHQDEPDNAQWDEASQSYTYCIAPSVLVGLYDGWKSADASRPVLLNFGQGVANIGWYGRWYLDNIGGKDYSGDNYSLYYTEASVGADILSYDIYPVTSPDDNVVGRLELVPSGVRNLISWSGGTKPVWNCIETTHISGETRPTADQIRSEVWMSIIAGSMGIIYFVHEWYPVFDEPGIFNYQDAVDAVTAINAQIAELAPVLNTGSLTGVVTVDSGITSVPMDIMVKNYGGDIYIFSSVLRNTAVNATFTVSGVTDATVEVLGETHADITMTGNTFQDDFAGYGVHIYRVNTP